ncbi:Monocarboxylate transporter 6 like protein [Argiope bruennichi]|uniref:Monocarboxylate transporter 6 like protein n=1 Tax=Argiope bruennichi TaxID=94029 RepID=A0A8T0EET4_ARGBR|nr:Monocarboxylate transporter 6 like protein [Argiope bruennichi]
MKKLSKIDINSGVAGFLSFLILGFVMCTTRVASLLFVDAITRYNVDRERASFPFILCYMTRNSIGPIVGFFIKKFGFRSVTITGCILSAASIGGCFFAEDIVTVTILWGVVYGISFGFGTLSVPHFLSLHFSKHLDKANGIALAGDSVGYFLVSLLVEYSLITYGLSGTFLIISGVMLHSVPAAFLLKIPEETCIETALDSSTEKYNLEEIHSEVKGNSNSPANSCNILENTQQKSTVHAFRIFLDPVYILIVVIQSAMLYNYSTTYTILIDVSRDNGVSFDQEVYVFLAVSIAELFGRLFLGSITDAGYLTKLNFSALSFASMGLLYATLIWIKGPTIMMVFGFFFGLILGGLNTVNSGVVTAYIDKEYHSIAVPSRLILYPPVSFTQAPLIGYFRDTLQSYDGLFYILIGICVLSSLICVIIPHIVVWRKNRMK